MTSRRDSTLLGHKPSDADASATPPPFEMQWDDQADPPADAIPVGANVRSPTIAEDEEWVQVGESASTPNLRSGIHTPPWIGSAPRDRPAPGSSRASSRGSIGGLGDGLGRRRSKASSDDQDAGRDTNSIELNQTPRASYLKDRPVFTMRSGSTSLSGSQYGTVSGLSPHTWPVDWDAVKNANFGQDEASGPAGSRRGAPRDRAFMQFVPGLGLSSGSTGMPSIARSTSNNAIRRRPRCNSLALPATTSQAPLEDSLLPHYSLDTKFSRSPGGLHCRDGTPVKLDLGLGIDFNQTVEEAFSRGLEEGTEVPLPREAVRVLTEARSMAQSKSATKGGRKGSLGMGLFKESTSALKRSRGNGAVKDGGKDHRSGSVAESDGIAEEEREDGSGGGVTMAGARSVGRGPFPRLDSTSSDHSSTHSEPLEDEERSLPPVQNIIVNKPAAHHRPPPSPAIAIHPKVPSHPVSVSSSPTDGYRFRSRHASASEASEASDGLLPDEDESGWTSEESEDSWATSHSSGPESGPEEENAGLSYRVARQLSFSAPNESIPEGDTPVGRVSRQQTPREIIQGASQRMTIPLEPFHHKVGGHSEIYKFSRRAVCKVGPE